MDQKTMEWFDRVMGYYSAVNTKTQKMIDKMDKPVVHLIPLGRAAQNCVNASQEVVDVLKEMRTAMIIADGGTIIKAKDRNKPQLRLIVDNTKEV